MAERLNWLRAAVLGANDGIVSTAGLLLGVAGADASASTLLLTGVAGLVAGALSMAAGEYVSVSTQRDTEMAAIAHERRELATMPEAELQELAHLLQGKGLSPELALQAAKELSAHNALAAHAEIELGLSEQRYANPWQAAAASAIAFSAGALIPLLPAVLLGSHGMAPTVAAVLLALCTTGVVSAKLGQAPVAKATLRNVMGGSLAMAATYWIGTAVAAFGA
ncbi:VIT family protein [Lampropedia puyangensis]|uniref:VIT family protein n=2 Tax=Lampropedia puyangensis TaxID=1330072 RepID=A0A4S8ES78_9BURK|nr:VIT family protein [Lampropedia puyangensis]